MKHKINPFAEQFALKTDGVLLFHHGLNLVLYDYGSSPSLACWTDRQRKRSENLHVPRSRCGNGASKSCTGAGPRIFFIWRLGASNVG